MSAKTLEFSCWLHICFMPHDSIDFKQGANNQQQLVRRSKSREQSKVYWLLTESSAEIRTKRLKSSKFVALKANWEKGLLIEAWHFDVALFNLGLALFWCITSTDA